MSETTPQSDDPGNAFPLQFFTASRPRPHTLSGPESYICPGRCREILETEDGELDWIDFQDLFNEFEALGTYTESVYFLPYAFSRILSHPKEALDMIESVLGFASRYAKQLKADGDLDAVRSTIRRVLEAWTSRFDATPSEADVFIDGVCVEGRFDHVQQGQLLDEALWYLIRGEAHRDLAEDFVLSLAQANGDPSKASWLLTLARWNALGFSELHANTFISKLLRDEEVLAAAATTVRDKLSELGKQSWYWEDCFDWPRT